MNIELKQVNIVLGLFNLIESLYAEYEFQSIVLIHSVKNYRRGCL